MQYTMGGITYPEGRLPHLPRGMTYDTQDPNNPVRTPRYVGPGSQQAGWNDARLGAAIDRVKRIRTRIAQIEGSNGEPNTASDPRIKAMMLRQLYGQLAQIQPAIAARQHYYTGLEQANRMGLTPGGSAYNEMLQLRPNAQRWLEKSGQYMPGGYAGY